MSLSTIFLLGAGASHKAGIAGIESMTSAFINEIPDLVHFYYERYDFTLEDYDETLSEEAFKMIHKDIKKGRKGSLTLNYC